MASWSDVHKMPDGDMRIATYQHTIGSDVRIVTDRDAAGDIGEVIEDRTASDRTQPRFPYADGLSNDTTDTKALEIGEIEEQIVRDHNCTFQMRSRAEAQGRRESR